jgi:hypothetical protein
MGAYRTGVPDLLAERFFEAVKTITKEPASANQRDPFRRQ